MYPPFPASCPFRVSVTISLLPPHRSERAELPHSVPQTRLPVPAQACVIRGGNSGCNDRSSWYPVQVSVLPRVRRLSHFFQILRTSR